MEICDQSPDPATTYVYYYCYFAHNQDETRPFLNWMIAQLCRVTKNVPAILFKKYREGEEPSLADLLDALSSILVRFEVVYIIIDALDESNPRDDFLAVLQEFVAEPRFKSLQILTSSREYIDIERMMADLSTSVSMNNPYVEKDIRRRVQSILRSWPQFKKWPQDLLSEVEETVVKGSGGMFRWAVCQLDALKRLKCERSIVLKALKNLPRTLEETYDRIFTTIPEEERMVVHHILRWIAHHNEMYHGAGMPCLVLIKAVEASIAELTGEPNERFYDDDTLREICGCLIDISLKDSDLLGKPGSEYTAATLAHYTVREYLDSGCLVRIVPTQGPVLEGTWNAQLIEITMSEAQNVKSRVSSSRSLASKTSEVVAAVEGCFAVYYLMSSILCLYQWPNVICHRDILMKLAFDLVDPSKPHFESMIMVARASTYVQETSDATLLGFVWSLLTNRKTEHLCYLLILYADSKEYSLLVEKFLRENDRKRHLQDRLWLKMDWTIRFGSREYDNYRQVSGSVVEVFAQLHACFPHVLSYLIEKAAGMFDPSVILLLSIGGHSHKFDCQDSCLVKRLLILGADPNLKGYIVTPLQIAAYRHDFEAVHALLSHGAHPDSNGCHDGVAWEEGTVMSQINHLHGASPLRIVRKYTSIEKNLYGKASIEEKQKKVEALLLQHGAKEISTSYAAALNEAEHAQYAEERGRILLYASR